MNTCIKLSEIIPCVLSYCVVLGSTGVPGVTFTEAEPPQAEFRLIKYPSAWNQFVPPGLRRRAALLPRCACSGSILPDASWGGGKRREPLWTHPPPGSNQQVEERDAACPSQAPFLYSRLKEPTLHSPNHNPSRPHVSQSFTSRHCRERTAASNRPFSSLIHNTWAAWEPGDQLIPGGVTEREGLQWWSPGNGPHTRQE